MDFSFESDILDSFLNLPRRAQEVLVYYLINHDDLMPFFRYMIISCGDLNYEECESPIEVIFSLAYGIFLSNIGGVEQEEFRLIPQYEVSVEENTYRADFAIRSSGRVLLIECDGHKYHHSTKEQVARDNERDYCLKCAGYYILHFSGSQIYNNPFKCAKDVYEYMKSIVGEV